MYATTTLKVAPATEKQFAFLRRLLAERSISASLTAKVELARADAVNGTLTRASASELIDLLLDAPKAEQAPRDEVEFGVYRDGNGDLYRVYPGQKSGRALVKSLIVEDGEAYYTYLGSAARALPAEAVRLSLDEVGSLGATYGVCLACGRTLTDPESVDRGIGPICASNY